MEAINKKFMKEYGYDETVFKIEIDKNLFLLDGKYYNLIQENELWKESSSDWRANPSSKNLYPKVLDEILNIIRNKYCWTIS